MRPTAGVVPVSLEGVTPGNLRDVARRDASDTGNEKMCRNAIALIRLDLPVVVVFEKLRGDYSGVELDVAA